MSQIKERPILFSAPMVRAILEGRKTVTRRAVKFPFIDRAVGCELSGNEIGPEEIRNNCPYGVPGQRLWVRETWYCDHFEVMRGPYLKPDDLNASEALDDGALVYAADGLTPYEADQPIWKPSIHMPRWACRILLEITDVRVERLQDITYEQAAAEGVHRGPLREWCASDEGGNCHKYPVPAFRDLWQSVGGNWDANPWVWVVEFKRVTS
ncbi:hypothetical protein P3S72_19405 [Pseudomonas sp. D3]|uniref:hypothetical protein n=1 Tax=Pseudomonas sp. D3 TaxID=517398 RepID=UPI0023E3A7F3|nr:hypothetical protein [Pseudomonas sp. D3]WET08663.1 hypothetical protein P3S72_19405 [Pseudomonas sp. D3]